MKTILIVDDELSTRTLISRILSNVEDTAVETAANGKEAVDIISKMAVDLVVTDLVMPEMDGFELLAYIKENHPEIPVFVMTAHESPEIDAKLKRLKFAEYFSKPLLMDEFKSRLMEELDSGAEGQIRGISLVSFLQLVEMETKTCTLTIKSKSDNKSGKLYFFKGELITAETGDLKNEDAVVEIVGWDNTSISIAKHCKKQTKEMTQPLLNILMEGIRLKDEKTAKENAGRRPLKRKPVESTVKLKPAIQPKPKPEDQKKAAPVDQKKAEPADQKKTETVEQKKAEPADQKKTEPVEQKKAEPADQKKTEPVEQKKAEPADQKKTEPVEQKKAEPADQKKQEPTKTSDTTDKAQLDRLIGVLENISEILEFSIFDQKDTIIKTGDGAEKKTDVKPSSIFAVSDQIGDYLEYGIPVSLIFNTDKGDRHIIFRHKDNNALVTLRSGYSPITFLSKLKLIKV